MVLTKIVSCNEEDIQLALISFVDLENQFHKEINGKNDLLPPDTKNTVTCKSHKVRKLFFSEELILDILCKDGDKRHVFEVRLKPDEKTELLTVAGVLTVEGTLEFLRNIDVGPEDGQTDNQILIKKLNKILPDKHQMEEGRCISRNKILVNFDFYQQIALAEYLNVRLYNLKGSEAVYKVLKQAGLRKSVQQGGKRVHWFFTGEQYANTRNLNTYNSAGIVKANEIGFNGVIQPGHRFCYRNIVNGYWLNLNPDYRNGGGAVVLAGLK